MHWRHTASNAPLGASKADLSHDNNEQRIHLGVRLYEMVVRARLNLAVTPSPALLPTLSHLQVRLNDKLLSVIPIRADNAGERIVRTIDLDPPPVRGRQLAQHAKNSRKGSVHEFIQHDPQVPLRFDSGFDARPSEE